MRHLLPAFVLSTFFVQTVLAQTNPDIYPFKPYTLEEIRSKVTRMTEEARPIVNVYEMERRNLIEKNTNVQPWAGYFWALIQGQTANTWQDKSIFQFWEMLGWEGNVNRWKTRKEQVLTNVINMSDEDLAKLAPSEKYDLLLGDTTFDLTNRIWNYVETYGRSKKWGFLSSIEIPEGYRLPEANQRMALWEGICHGWALAAGAFPRPEHGVTINLPNGKKLLFYPDDIKALTSLLFANSIVQDNVNVEGLRCDEKRPEQDEFGRYIDAAPTREGEQHLPKCADVHPAVWHASVVNLTGIQGRSFVVEIDYHQNVNNHPLSGYKFQWFNPKTGRSGNLAKAVIDLAGYADPYRSSRSPLAVKLVGVEMEMRYTDWKNPSTAFTDGPEKDKIANRKFMYDLELDAAGNIVGGQWRATRTARAYENGRASRRGSRNDINDGSDRPPRIRQPDFFWSIPKNYMNYFRPLALEAWNGRGTAPQSWQQPAKAAHSFIYNMTREYGFNEKCTVLSGRTTKEVPCEFKYPRPQPLLNVINKLLQMSRN